MCIRDRFTAWTKTQAKVNVPESLQNSKDLRFAFVYTGKGGSNLSLDNVQLYAEERDNYVAVTASAGEGGAIDPAGQTLVKKGTSKTFTVTPAQGYEIANVTVDGTDLGPISYYTFQRVGVDLSLIHISCSAGRPAPAHRWAAHPGNPSVSRM